MIEKIGANCPDFSYFFKSSFKYASYSSSVNRGTLSFFAIIRLAIILLFLV